MYFNSVFNAIKRLWFTALMDIVSADGWDEQKVTASTNALALASARKCQHVFSTSYFRCVDYRVGVRLNEHENKERAISTS